MNPMKRTMWSKRQFLLGAAAGLAAPAIARAEPMRLRLGHGLPTTHPVHPSLELFADSIREKSGGAIEITIFPDGQIGQEVDLIAQGQAGKLDFLKVSASVLEKTASAFRIFSLPFMFRDRAHWASVTRNGVGEAILAAVQPFGLRGLTYYDAGSRSFYARTPIEHPDALRGMKIRIQASPTMTEMMRLFGAEGVVMPWEQVYPALKNRFVDGAENSVVALIVGRHGEVVTHYAFDEHTMVPDVLLVSLARWQSFTPTQQNVVREAAQASYQRMNELWGAFETQCRSQSEAMGVTFTYPDKRPFVEKAAPLVRAFADDPILLQLKQRIEQS